MYLSADLKGLERNNAHFNDLSVLLFDPLQATISSWFIPSFSSELEIYFYSEWMIFYISSPRDFDVKRAISAVRLVTPEK